MPNGSPLERFALKPLNVVTSKLCGYVTGGHIEICRNISKYLNGAAGLDGRRPKARDASFDYCFNYFQLFREAENVGAIAEWDMTVDSAFSKSTYVLASRVAAWGWS